MFMPHTPKLTGFALDMLNQRHREDIHGHGWVFPSLNGEMIGGANLNRAWRDARGDAYGWVTWRSFRKAVATRANEVYGPEAAARALGHTTPATTKAHYIATSDATVVPDISAILEALAGVNPATAERSDDG